MNLRPQPIGSGASSRRTAGTTSGRLLTVEGQGFSPATKTRALASFLSRWSTRAEYSRLLATACLRQIDTPCHSKCPVSCRKQTTGAPSDRHNSAPFSVPPYFDTIFSRESDAQARKSPSATHGSPRVRTRSLTRRLRANSIGLITQLRSEADRRSEGGSVRGPRHASLASRAGSGEGGHHVQRIP